MAIILLLSSQAHAQKLMIPRMVPGGGDIIQVEGNNGQPIKINYSFNFHKEKVVQDNQTSYPMVHDEVFYYAALNKLTINKSTYLLESADQPTKKIVQKSIAVNYNAAADGTPLKNAFYTFIQQVVKEAGLTGKKGHSLAVLQIDNVVIKNSIIQMENLSGK